MAHKLTVLYPDGHRKVLNVTPNTSVYQVLEEACKNKGYAVDDYSLRHYKTVLSPGSTVRFSNLPNNALLELVQSESQGSISSSKVTICLQGEDGARQTADFQSSETLWDVVEKFDAAAAGGLLRRDPRSVPVCVYANSEIVGADALAATSLRQLGLMSGRHMVRLLHRQPEDIGVQAYAADLPAARPGPTPPKAAAAAAEASSSRRPAQQQLPPPQPAHSSNSGQKNPYPRKPAPEIKLNVKDFRVGGTSSAESSRREEQRSAAERRLGTASSGNTLGGATAGGPSYAPEAKGESVFLDDEGTLAFHADSSSQAFPHLDVPDDFFQHTVQDVKYLYRSLKTEREALEEAPLLTTDQRRERERQRKVATSGGICILRTHFPDRIVLQGLFSVEDTVGAVRSRIRGFLRRPATNFYLYLTPPRRVLDDSETLLEAGCCPTSVLFFGTEGAAGSSSGGEPFLNDHVMNNLSTASGAISWAKRKRAILPIAPEDPKAAFADYLSANAVPESSMEIDATASDRRAATAADGGNAGVVPKWFKLKK